MITLIAWAIAVVMPLGIILIVLLMYNDWKKRAMK